MATRRKRKTSTRRKRTTKRGLSGRTARCKVVTVNGKRRRLCFNTKGRIRSNTAVRSKSRKRRR